MLRSIKFNKKIIKVLLLVLIASFFSGCELAPGYFDPETGELVGEVSRLSLLKQSSIKTIVPTTKNVFFLMNNSTVLVTGSNEIGLLGQGNTEEYDYVVQAKLPERIKYLSANDTIAIAVSDTNNIYIWGDLSWWGDDTGVTTTADGFKYRKFNVGSIITAVSASKEHVAILTKDGSVYTLGFNRSQLGYDMGENIGIFYSEFRKAEIDIPITAIETSPTATYMLASSGAIYGASANESFELGYIDALAPVNKLVSVEKFIDFATAGSNLFALSEDGAVFVCGQNTHGVLGLNNSLPYAAALTKIPFQDNLKIKDINGNDTESSVFFITKSNELYACGNNFDGALYTDSTEDDVISPTHVNVTNVLHVFPSGSAKFYVDTNRRLYTYGTNEYNQMPIMENESHEGFIAPIRIYANVK